MSNALADERTAGLVLERARIFIKKKWPFMMSAVYGLIPVETDQIDTCFVTPGLVFGYNPHFIKILSDSQGAFAVLHETFHPRLEFFERVAGKPDEYRQIANIAHDLVINVMLRDGGFEPTPGALFPKTFGFPEGLTMEEYIELLMKNKKAASGAVAQSKQEAQGGDKSSGKSGGKNKKNEKNESKSGNPSKTKAEGSDEGEDEELDNVCGGGCANPNSPLQQQFEQEYGRTKANVKAIDRKVSNDIKEAMGSMPGKVPGLLQQLIEKPDDEESRIPWPAILEDLVRGIAGRIMSGGDDFSMKHPSKRSHLRRILRPGLVDHEMVILFVLDTSGSMSEIMLWRALRETVAILRSLGIEEVYWMENDTQVELEPQRVDLSFFEKEGGFVFHGRGGTDFRPPFKTAKTMDIDLMIFWTDGEGPAPTEAPDGFEVLWGVIPGDFYGRKPARWGHLVVVHDDPERQKQIEEMALIEDVEEEEDEA